jgi:hypothetical protein
MFVGRMSKHIIRDHRHRSIAVCFIDGDDAAAPSASENAFDGIKDGHDYGSAEEKSIKKSPDVCYMCGSDLSHFGLKSRVAHVKRCSVLRFLEFLIASI